jgi:CBS domain-containing protein
MTTDVLTVGRDTSLKDVAAMLGARGISGAPVVDDDGALLGVISEADILAKERRPPERSRVARVLGLTEPPDPKSLARTAGEAMTAPPVTIAANARVDRAATLMLDRSVNRLPVLDRAGVLVGIVTRADLVRAFVVDDATIGREIREEVLLHELWLDPDSFEVTVENGEVTIAGEIHREDEAALLERRIRLVPGVVSVQIRAAELR